MPTKTSNTLDVVMAIYDAFSRGDLPAVLERIDADADLIFEGSPAIPWSGHWRGHQGWTQFFQTLGGHVADISLTMEPFAIDGERAVVLGRYKGNVRDTGRPIDSPLVHLWTVRHGVVVTCVELTNTAAEASACVFR